MKLIIWSIVWCRCDGRTRKMFSFICNGEIRSVVSITRRYLFYKLNYTHSLFLFLLLIRTYVEEQNILSRYLPQTLFYSILFFFLIGKSQRNSSELDFWGKLVHINVPNKLFLFIWWWFVCVLHSNCAPLKTWTVVIWRAVTPPRCILLQATTAWPSWNTCCIMGPMCTLKIKGTIIFLWLSLLCVGIIWLSLTLYLSLDQWSGSFTQRVFVWSLWGGRAAGETWSVCERGGPLEVHTITWSCSQGQIWDLQTTAQGLIPQIEKSCTCWPHNECHDCVGISYFHIVEMLTAYFVTLYISL